MKLTCCVSATAALAMLVGCSADSEPTVAGGGKITPTISINAEVVEASSARSTDGISLTPADFSLTLTSANGAVSRTWDRATDFPTDELWSLGEYNLTAVYGDIDTEGFDSPCYKGETPVTVTEAVVATPTITCSLANAMISIDCTEAFKGFFTSYAVQVVTPSAHTIDYPNDETRPLYVKPGNVTLIIELTKPNGLHATFTPTEPIEAEARHHYRVTLDVNSGQMGQGVLVVNFDNTVTNEDIVIDLSDELMNSPAPEIFANGFDPATPLEMVEGQVLDNVSMTVQARAGLSGLRLSANSPSLAAKGFPTDCDLMRLTPEQMSLVQQLGLNCLGVWSNPDRTAVVDFTKLLGNVTDPQATFAITAIDKYSKASNPMILSVITNAVTVAAADAPSAAVGDKECTLRLSDATPNVNINAFSLRAVLDNGDVVTPCITSRHNDGRVVTLTFEMPEGRKDMPLQVYYAGELKTTTTVTRTCDDFRIEIDPFATKATITVVHPDTERAQAIARQLDVVGNGRLMNVISRDASTATVVVAGLSPNTSYTVKGTALYGNAKAEYTPEVNFETEGTAQLPDPGFENAELKKEIVDMPQGGRYSRTHLAVYNHQNSWSYNLYLPKKYWATTNAKTFDNKATNYNTWYVQPSAQIVGDSHTGTKAMKLTSVAYDPAGEVIADYAQRPGEFLPYNANVPEIRYRAAGRLFLGEYVYDRATMSEEYSQGYAFTSRPSTLNGYYKYIPGLETPSDRGYVSVVLVASVNGEELEIGSGDAELVVASGYTSFQVPIQYNVRGIKPEKILVMFASTTSIGSIAHETSTIITTPNLANSTSIGSALWVDELTLGY